MDIDEKLSELENQVNNQSEEKKQIIEKPLEEMTYDEAKENIKKVALVATSNDKNYVSELHEQSKDVLKASIDLEREKVEKEKQEILLEQEKLATEKEKNLNERLRAGFGAKLDKQDYHYKSLQPILETFGIKKAMNVYVMWAIAILGCISMIYPLKLLFCATFGNLIAGANSDNRKGFAKGCMWTMVAILGIAVAALIIFGVVKLGMKMFNS